MNTQPSNSTLHTNLLAISNTAAGFSASDVTGFSPELVRRTAESMVRQGLIVRATVSPRRVRYFANPTLASAYAAGQSRPTQSQVSIGMRTKAPWRADEPALITPSTRIVIAPPLPRNVYRTNTYSQF